MEFDHLFTFIKYSALWFGLHELLARSLPIPKNILKVEDSKQRKIDFLRMVSDIVALVHAPLACYSAGRLLLRDPKVFNELHGPEYIWNLIVSLELYYDT
jgi:hypothetical protein